MTHPAPDKFNPISNLVYVDKLFISHRLWVDGGIFLTMEHSYAKLILIGQTVRRREYISHSSLNTTIIFEEDGVGSVVLCGWSGHSI